MSTKLDHSQSSSNLFLPVTEITIDSFIWLHLPPWPTVHDDIACFHEKQSHQADLFCLHSKWRNARAKFNHRGRDPRWLSGPSRSIDNMIQGKTFGETSRLPATQMKKTRGQSKCQALDLIPSLVLQHYCCHSCIELVCIVVNYRKKDSQRRPTSSPNFAREEAELSFQQEQAQKLSVWFPLTFHSVISTSFFGACRQWSVHRFELKNTHP